MSGYDRLPSLEAQPTTMRREDDPEYSDDPEFQALADSTAQQLDGLTSKVGQLQNSVNLLGTRRDTEALRKRVTDLLDQARDGYREVGDAIKRLQSWETVNVRGFFLCHT
jgi:hypothetical protein